ncbi:ubiquitin carboxyl-terminal hydrolase [Absidia repens]|uniref:Ubiquitin carboxyl-terminal hydrolase n=1 Tax=Absidia repens TaxID=90262 RepID=A0A1X2J114_9FUNG|nr:ubiquitin carboxyl-terminal hydrolase [Absidia repens]
MVSLPNSKHALYPPWCLIESDPETFQSMTHMYGVRGVEVEEVLSLDDLLTVDRPIYGLIMSHALDLETLSEASGDNMDPDAASLFFSCQVITNVCATSALLGILLNTEDNDLVIGDELKNFKDFTKDFNPVDRGMAIANSTLLQKAHNTFASFESKLDAKRYPQYRDIKPAGYLEEDSPDYHYVAFIPAKGYVWELDGYNKVPIKLHKIADNWLQDIVLELKERMHKSGDVNFNMLAVAKSPEHPATASVVPPSLVKAPLASSPMSSTSASLLSHAPPSSSSTSTQEQHPLSAQNQYVYKQLIYRIEGYLDIICHNWRQLSFEEMEAMTSTHHNIQDALTMNPDKNPDEAIAKLINTTRNQAEVVSLLKLYRQAHAQLYRPLEGTSVQKQELQDPPTEAPKQTYTSLSEQDKNLLRRQHDYGPLIDALFNKLNEENLL